MTPVPDTHPPPRHFTDAVESSCVPTARSPTRKDACVERDGVSTGLTSVSDGPKGKDVLALPCPQVSRASSWKEMVELLK